MKTSAHHSHRLKALKIVTYLAACSCFATPSFGELPERIVWYGVLEDGLEEAVMTGKPILLTSAAPQCASVPGMW